MKLLSLRLSVLLGLLGMSIALATYAAITFDHESSEWYGPNHSSRNKSSVSATFDKDFSDFICPGNIPPPIVRVGGGGGGGGGPTGSAP